MPISLPFNPHRFTYRISSAWMSARSASGALSRRRRPDAVAMLQNFQDEIEPRLAKDGDLRPLGGFAGKTVGSAARFAALHHLGWYGPDGLLRPITVGSVTRGIKLARYAVEHYRYVMAATGFVTENAIADRIVGWCHRGQRSEFSRREVQRELGISRNARGKRSRRTRNRARAHARTRARLSACP
jgi:hypothetical protein